jgi:hypothetical protein
LSPTLQRQFDANGDPTGPPEPKQRVLAITAGDVGVQQAIRVTWDAQPNWPGGHSALVGQQKWMTEPFQVCEGAGSGFAISPPICGGSPGQPQKWFWAARLTCGSDGAHFADLTKLTDYCTGSGEACATDGDCAQGTCGVDGAIHIIDQGIVPSKNTNQQAIYSVQVIDAVCAFAENGFSEPLVVVQPVWGDNSGGTSCPREVPDGAAGLIPDVINGLNKFSNGLCALKKMRADVEPGEIDARINITDVLQLLSAFASGSSDYSFAAGPSCSVELDARDAARKIKPVRTSSRSNTGQ